MRSGTTLALGAALLFAAPQFAQADASAIADYDEALKLNPNMSIAYNNRGDVGTEP